MKGSFENLLRTKLRLSENSLNLVPNEQYEEGHSIASPSDQTTGWSVAEAKEAEEPTGLIVVGSSQIDNQKIGEFIENSPFHAEWNAREGYWFFPEEEENYDQLEKDLQYEFDARDIGARFEGVFQMSKTADESVVVTPSQEFNDTNHLTDVAGPSEIEGYIKDLVSGAVDENEDLNEHHLHTRDEKIAFILQNQRVDGTYEPWTEDMLEYLSDEDLDITYRQLEQEMGLVADSTFDEGKKKEKEPSLKPPKEWFNKMKKRIAKDNPEYDAEKVRATIGKIWYKDLTTTKKKEIRGRYDKKYGKAPKKESVEEVSERVLDPNTFSTFGRDYDTNTGPDDEEPEEWEQGDIINEKGIVEDPSNKDDIFVPRDIEKRQNDPFPTAQRKKEEERRKKEEEKRNLNKTKFASMLKSNTFKTSYDLFVKDLKKTIPKINEEVKDWIEDKDIRLTKALPNINDYVNTLVQIMSSDNGEEYLFSEAVQNEYDEDEGIAIKLSCRRVRAYLYVTIEIEVDYLDESLNTRQSSEVALRDILNLS